MLLGQVHPTVEQGPLTSNQSLGGCSVNSPLDLVTRCTKMQLDRINDMGL